ncbi:MAG TPA: ferredoxin family protein [Myxococcota bacterium]|nr:ferredoxin family protein [Myxococcota bacterium]
MPGLFIDVQVSEKAASDKAIAARLVEVCPVDIFQLNRSGELRIVEDNLDECVLCELCIDAAPSDAVKVVKLYE